MGEYMLRRITARVGIILVASAAALALVIAPVHSTPAHANPASGFKPGNIIADSLFYNGSAMTASQVQSFLNKRMPTHTSQSLRNYKQKTTSKSSSAYCSSYAGKSSETAAQIIYKVGKACGISQKALLVMLEKETSLVGMRSPQNWRYDRAMGYACPDTGPGGSANCDTSYYGFFNQVWNGARQLQAYGKSSYFSWFPVGKTSNIQYHPNKSCGTKSVRIVNKATAALHYYTPYTPNSAALNAGWGTGNSCSSYGNRNFYSFYKTWFGNPLQTIHMTGDIKKHYDANGKEKKFGFPTETRKHYSAHGAGYSQLFERGRITTSYASGKTFAIMNGPFHDRYTNLGGPGSAWGWLDGGALCGLSDSGCRLQFQKGIASYSASTGVKWVPAAIQKIWKENGYESGALGYPVKDPQSNSSGTVQEFKGGSAMSSKHGAFRLGAELTNAWKKPGGGLKGMGFITEPTVRVSPDRYYVSFEQGNLYVDSSSKTVRFGKGPFLDKFNAAGGPTGEWGWPKAPAKCGLPQSGCTMEFEAGTATYSADTGVVFVADQAQMKAWRDRGAGGGDLGYPVGKLQQYSDGSSLEYQQAHLFASPNKAVRFGSGPFLDSFHGEGGPDGAWGWPTAAAKCGLVGGGCTMSFENGTAIYSKKTGVTFTYSQAQLDAWKSSGRGSGNLGYPVEDTSTYADGSVQAYEHAHFIAGPEAGVRFGKGPFLNSFLGEGSVEGNWGWPQSGAVCGLPDSGCVMEFSNGTANYTKTDGVTFE